MAIDNGKSIESRRRFGQFATPYELAQEIMSFGLTLQDKKEISFLEPAFGTGAFYSALLSECDKHAKIINTAVGVEVDKDFYVAANELWGHTNVNLVSGDFTEIEAFENINFLVSNPPYVRHHYIDKEQKSKLSAMIQKETDLSLSGLSGLYCYFILSAHKWLAPDAICGWLIPSEFMDVNYGAKLKEYFLNKVHLLRVHRYNPENCKFDDALVSSCVVWFKNETMENNYDVEFSYGGTLERPEVSRNVDRNTLGKSRKWTHFPTNDEQLPNTHTPTLGDFFTIKRGLATGDNDFFILSKEEIEELNLDMNFFTPILPSPRYLKCNEVFSDKYGNPRLDTQYFLLSCMLPEEEVKKNHPSIWNYLSSGRGAAIWDEVKDRLKKNALGLSGGQQQRLCIARALAVEPEVLLMDEPTSALDPISTSKIEELAMQLKEQYTIVIVTHNMQQAVRISDRTAFFLLGELVECDDTQQLFSQPQDKRTEDYITGRFG